MTIDGGKTIGRVLVSTMEVPDYAEVVTATYLFPGKVLVVYRRKEDSKDGNARDYYHLAVQAELIDVEYPWGIAEHPGTMMHWSEIIVAPDNRHIAWTTLRHDVGAAAFVGALKREADRYIIEKTQMISSAEFLKPDPDREGFVIPQPALGGEVKQFIRGGSAISSVGSARAGCGDSVIQNLLEWPGKDGC